MKSGNDVDVDADGVEEDAFCAFFGADAVALVVDVRENDDLGADVEADCSGRSSTLTAGGPEPHRPPRCSSLEGPTLAASC